MASNERISDIDSIQMLHELTCNVCTGEKAKISKYLLVDIFSCCVEAELVDGRISYHV